MNTQGLTVAEIIEQAKQRKQREEEENPFCPEGIEGQTKAWYRSQVEQYFQEGYTLQQAHILANMLYHQTTGYQYFIPEITFHIEGGFTDEHRNGSTEGIEKYCHTTAYGVEDRPFEP